MGGTLTRSCPWGAAAASTAGVLRGLGVEGGGRLGVWPMSTLLGPEGTAACRPDGREAGGWCGCCF